MSKMKNSKDFILGCLDAFQKLSLGVCIDFYSTILSRKYKGIVQCQPTFFSVIKCLTLLKISCVFHNFLINFSDMFFPS